jgi:hypothetical protein
MQQPSWARWTPIEFDSVCFHHSVVGKDAAVGQYGIFADNQMVAISPNISAAIGTKLHFERRIGL